MILTIAGVRFGYGSKEILKGVSFEAEGNEIVGILGQNGSGKTTLLNCINTLLKPESGIVFLNHVDMGQHESRDVHRMDSRDLARHMATVSQNSNAYFPFTVLDTVKMGRYARTKSHHLSQEDIRIVSDAISSVGLEHLVERDINELSGGEYRRTMIARALAQEPDILLLDEPTLHLDLSHQFDLMDLVKRLVKEKGILAVVVTHDLVLAARYCDRILLMEKGEIVEAGTASEVITPENIRRVFHVRADVGYSEKISGLNVFIYGKATNPRCG
mgnify:CR=1 FL=1